MIYAEPIIMYEVHCPQCDTQIILFREDLYRPVHCEQCSLKFEVSAPVEEVGELIYDRTG